MPFMLARTQETSGGEMNKLTPEEIKKAIEQLKVLYDLAATGLDAISAIALQLGIEALEAQLAKDERGIEELEAQVEQCLGVIKDLKDNLAKCQKQDVCPEFPSINEWLDKLGIDRAYKKDMKPTYLLEKETACKGTGKKQNKARERVREILEYLCVFDVEDEIIPIVKKAVLKEFINVLKTIAKVPEYYQPNELLVLIEIIKQGELILLRGDELENWVDKQLDKEAEGKC